MLSIIKKLRHKNHNLLKDIRELNTICNEQVEKIDYLQNIIDKIFYLLDCHHEKRLVTIKWREKETYHGRLIVCKHEDEAKQFYARSFPVSHEKRYSSTLDIKSYYPHQLSPDIE